MGYYTRHILTVRNIHDNEQFRLLSEELKERDLIGYAFDYGNYDNDRHEAIFYAYEDVKWYDHDKDMIMIAEKFPNMYFELEGEGEEYGDLWREYYHDMDCEHCCGEIIFEAPKRIKWKELIAF